MEGLWVQFLGQEDPLKKEMATHSSILAWKIPWTEDPGGLQSMGSQELDTTDRLSTCHVLDTILSLFQILSHLISNSSAAAAAAKLLQSCPTLATPWTIARQVPLSMGFSRQEYWSGLPFPPLGDLPNPGIKPRSLTLQVDSFTS